MPEWIRIADVPTYYYHQTGEKLPNPGTVRHWMKHGKRGYSGTLVKLRYRVRNGLWFTTKAWVDEFIGRIGRIVFDEIPRCNGRLADNIQESDQGV